VAGASP
jgi:hypothetical protein